MLLRALRSTWLVTGLLPCFVLAADPVPVSVAPVEMQQPVRELLINGTLAADQASRLSPSVSGLVSRLHVDIGSRVESGDVLLELDPELNRVALQQARATFKQQQTTLADLERQFAEASSLIAKRSIAASEVRSLEAQVEAGKAALAASQADVGRQQALLARHTLKAPFSGVISAKLTEVGEWVTPGTPVLDLVGTGQLHADFAVPQRYYSQISSTTALTVRQENALSGLSDDADGIVASIAAIVPVSDPSARTFTLRASVDAEGLTPGMAVFGTLAIQSQQAEPVVPRDALLRDVQGNVSVWLAVEDEEHGLVAQRRAIKVRPGQSDPVIVTDGLRQGDQVVIRGNESLREGDAVLVAQ